MISQSIALLSTPRFILIVGVGVVLIVMRSTIFMFWREERTRRNLETASKNKYVENNY